ncbi:unnamed protein product [Phytomonas sp. EM1]|nr:unnamed protein product [Phytomonas sp. EM1]|eukprot:CCW60133.1 unnamed protein product [Phytomonas sp. isolate EM1]
MAEETTLVGADFHIRRAVSSDCPAMLQLVRELAEYEKALDKVTVSLEEMTACGFGPKPIWGAYVVELKGDAAAEAGNPTVVGMALYHDRYSTWKGRLLYLEDFVVSESYRGKGIGHALFECVLAHAKREGYQGMVWQVLEWNEPALNFYRKYNADLDPEWVNGMIFF